MTTDAAMTDEDKIRQRQELRRVRTEALIETRTAELVAEFRAQQALMSAADLAVLLNTLLRQRHCWVTENNPESLALVGARHRQIADLKAELGVTDEAAFLASRGAP
jgi:hypothetical protein